VPASVKLQEQFGDDVQVLFVECQNTPKDVYEAFAWKMKWMGNGAMWTAERPFPTKGSGLPETALVGIDGSLLMQGNPGDFGKKLEEAVAAEIKKAKQSPVVTPKETEKAWQMFAKGDVAGAIAECDKLGSDAAKEAKATFVERTSARIARAQWQIDNGYLGQAEQLLGVLEKAVKTQVDLAPKIAVQKSRLSAAELANEREADKAWTSFVAKSAKEKPFEPNNVKKAAALAAKYKGTKSAERAERFVALSKVDLNKAEK
jgi:hypothetical protein